MWHKIAERHQLDAPFMQVGQLATVQVERRRYCLGLLDEGYFAMDDKCPHAGGSLSHGKCDAAGNVSCPLHRFTFNLKTGRNTSGEGFGVGTYPVEERADGLWMELPEKVSFWKLVFGK